MDTFTPIGITNFRNTEQPFGIKDFDRMGHIYVIGKTGVGKSTLLLNMAMSDIEKGKGCCIIDPHGDLSETILNYIPLERIDDVVYFNPADNEYPIAFNPLKAIHPHHRHLVASGLISTFKKIWAESWGPRLEYILRFALLTLLEFPDATLLDIQPLLTDPYFRTRVVGYVTDPYVAAFWSNEFDKYPPALRSEAITPILNKTGIFLSSIPLRNMVGQKVRSINIQQIMDSGKILICNLSKGALGEEVSAILGSMLVTAMQLAALYRSAIPEPARQPFYLYVDEVHSFISLSFADILAEARKYRLSIFLTHQYIEQLPDKIRAAIFGNVGTFIAFRVGAEDADYVAKEFEPVFSKEDIINLPKYQMYLKLMIDGATSKPFSAMTLEPQTVSKSYKEQVIAASQRRYGRPKEKVEVEILSRKHLDKKSISPRTLFTE